jgi:hypothetical protein
MITFTAKCLPANFVPIRRTHEESSPIVTVDEMLSIWKPFNELAILSFIRVDSYKLALLLHCVSSVHVILQRHSTRVCWLHYRPIACCYLGATRDEMCNQAA